MSELSFWDSAFLWREAMLASVVGAALLSFLGVYVVLTRNAFASAAVSNLAGLGIVLALLLGAMGLVEVPPFAAGVALGVVGTALFGRAGGGARLPTDALLAVAVVGASAVTLVLARFLTREYQHVQAALHGDAVVASGAELWLTCGVAAAVLGLHLFYRHRLLLVAFDAEMARAQGMKANRWRLLLGITLALSISVVSRGLGALPAFAFSVLPAAAALLLTERLSWAFALSMALGIGSAAGGYYLSFVHDLPTGPTMVAVALAALLVAGASGRWRR